MKEDNLLCNTFCKTIFGIAGNFRQWSHAAKNQTGCTKARGASQHFKIYRNVA